MKLKVKTTAFHPQSNGSLERSHHALGEFPKEYSKKDCQWYQRVEIAIFIYNTCIHEGTKHRPFEVVFGRLSRSPSCEPLREDNLLPTYQGYIKDLVTRLTGTDLSHNLIHLRSVTPCTLSNATCMDVEGGHKFWNPIPVSNCKFYKYSILYKGYAIKINDLIHNHFQTVYSLATDDITFALVIKSAESVCGYTVFRTDHPKLVIFETVKGESFAGNYKLAVENVDLFAYINYKFIYVEKHQNTNDEFV